MSTTSTTPDRTVPFALIVEHGGETYAVDHDGRIGRPEIGMRPSDAWRIVGAVRLNNFGRVVERFTWEDVRAGKVAAWRHGNGSQRVYMLDRDHGSKRMWGSPCHSARRAPADWNPYGRR